MELSSAQDGAGIAYSPYSVFGVGDLYQTGTARDRAMGGVGIAGRDPRYINITNPAAVSARDSLSVMFDLGMVSDNRYFRQRDIRSSNNTFNISNLAVSFPIYRRLSFIAGITPYSSVAYDYAYDISDSDIMADAGFINYYAKGKGGLYQLFTGLGTSFWNRLSIGGQAILNFGSINKDSAMNFSESTYRSMNSGYELKLNGVAGKFGIQYEQPFGDVRMTLGATYRTSTKLGGHVTDYKYASLGSVVDTVSYRVDNLAYSGRVSLASETGAGISFRKAESWSAEFNYDRSDWTGCGFESTGGFANVGKSVFSTKVSQSFKAGFEYIPNRNDMRYYLRQCAYRMGAYYRQSYYRLDGNSVDSYGITLGVTFPIVRMYNGISLGLDLGRKGSMKGNMTMENYVTFVIGFNVHDLWFIKQRYD